MGKISWILGPLLLLALVGYALAMPPLQADYSDSVTINEKPVPVGNPITANNLYLTYSAVFAEALHVQSETVESQRTNISDEERCKLIGDYVNQHRSQYKAKMQAQAQASEKRELIIKGIVFVIMTFAGVMYLKRITKKK